MNSESIGGMIEFTYWGFVDFCQLQIGKQRSVYFITKNISYYIPTSY